MTLLDDLGAPVRLDGAPRRVVSLVPSLTEAVAETVPKSLVGATDWCTRPEGLDVARVRGTKNPNLEAIRALEPDLVIANHEENRRVDVERLRESGVDVWVTRIDTIDDALRSLGRLFGEAFGLSEEPGWLAEARLAWGTPAIDDTPGEADHAPAPPTVGESANPPTEVSTGSATREPLRVAVPIWRDPWSWIGSDTYADDVLTRMGWVNVVAALDRRYPRLDVATVLAETPAVLLLPDEPYAFGPTDGPEVLPGPRHVFISGRPLFWYGPSMAQARRELEAAVNG